MKSARAVSVRRVPAQDRGKKRIHAILDAAALVVAERGFEGATLSEVAERSGSAVGSLYRFFSSKEQLTAALARRISAEIEQSADFVPPISFEKMNLSSFVVWYADWLVETFRRYPALGGLLHRAGPHCEPLENTAMTPIAAYLSHRAAYLSKSERSLVTRMALEIVIAGLKLPEKSRVATKTAMLHIQSALLGYLGEILRVE